MSENTADPAKNNTAKKKPKEKKGPGIGDVAKDAIRAGKTNIEALEAVKAVFPDAKTSMAAINWYRQKLRDDGEKVPTARELTKAATEAKKAQEKADKPTAEKGKKGADPAA